MLISQGVFWVDFGTPIGSGPGYKRPCVVVQNNLFNHSRIGTVVVCVLTSNLRRAQAPGNLLLDAGEANLPEQSVVVISQLYTLDKRELQEKIGRLSEQRISSIIESIHKLLQPL